MVLILQHAEIDVVLKLRTAILFMHRDLLLYVWSKLNSSKMFEMRSFHCKLLIDLYHILLWTPCIHLFVVGFWEITVNGLSYKNMLSGSTSAVTPALSSWPMVRHLGSTCWARSWPRIYVFRVYMFVCQFGSNAWPLPWATAQTEGPMITRFEGHLGRVVQNSFCSNKSDFRST